MVDRVSNEPVSTAVRVPVRASTCVAASVGAVAVGAIVIAAPEALLALFGLCALFCFVALCFSHARVALVVLVFLLVAYAPDVAGQRLDLPVSAQALMAILVVGVLAEPTLRRKVTSLTWPAIGFAALLLTMLLSATFASSSDVAMRSIGDQAKNAVLALVMVGLIDSAQWLRRTMLAFALGAVVLASLTVAQQLSHSYSSDFGGFAVVSTIGHSYRSEGPLSANYFGQMLVVAAVLLFYVSTARTRRLAAIGIGLCLLAIVYTMSRGSVLALAVAFVTMALLQRWRIGVFLIAGLVVAISIVLVPPQFKERWFELSNPTAKNEVDLSTRQRLGENLAAVQMFEDHPLLGVGPGNFEVQYLRYAPRIALDTREEPRQAHNLYLEVLAERGVVGALVFTIFMLATVAGAWRARRRFEGEEKAVAEAAFVALVAVLASALFLHAAYARYFWITVGFALASYHIAMQRPATVGARPEA